jgi:ParB family chromosome partitioning protein
MGNNTATITPDAQAIATGELLNLDPAELVLQDNVRTDPVLGKDFIESIATGVRLPLYAVRAADGTVKVRDGQRRMLAAREAALASIPVYVVPADAAESDDAERTRRRIIDQVTANEARADLKVSEKAAAVAQLSLTGLAASKIAKVQHTSKETVDTALATAGSQTARSAVDAANLTLDQGMILAQYEDDPEAVDELVTAAAEGRFDHKAAELEETARARAAIRQLATSRPRGIHRHDRPGQHYRRLPQPRTTRGRRRGESYCR